MSKASKPPAPPPAAESAPDMAHSIWLAGLGAWAQAQAEGNKVFEALVRDGLSLQRQTHQGLAQATEKLAEMTARANDARWGKLGGLFENRVAQSLSRMGLPDATDWQALQARLDRIEAHLQALQPTAGAPAPGAPASRTPRKTTPSTAPRKAVASAATRRRKAA
ncbi:phasin family protein [Comamonas serinivorans]|nr:phasin family protein [Comamonas serinivorans]